MGYNECGVLRTHRRDGTRSLQSQAGKWAGGQAGRQAGRQAGVFRATVGPSQYKRKRPSERHFEGVATSQVVVNIQVGRSRSRSFYC